MDLSENAFNQSEVLDRLGEFNWQLITVDFKEETLNLGIKKLFQRKGNACYYLLLTDFKSIWFRYCSAKQAVIEFKVSVSVLFFF